MVKVIQEERLPAQMKRCSNCGSLLKYENSDIKIAVEMYPVFTLRTYRGYIVCPKCKNKIEV